MTLRQGTAIIVSCLLGGVFVWAAVGKLWNPARFVGDIRAYGPIPYPLAAFMALWIPWLELICGISLTLRRWRPAAAIILLVLVVCFTGALAWAWWRSIDAPCGCFGEAEVSRGYLWLVGRDLALLLGLAWLVQENGRHGECDGCVTFVRDK